MELIANREMCQVSNERQRLLQFVPEDCDNASSWRCLIKERFTVGYTYTLRLCCSRLDMSLEENGTLYLEYYTVLRQVGRFWSSRV